MRGISLDEIAATTKIGTRLLRALEEEHFDLLPGGIFNRGYVRAYAKYVGIDEDQAVADYLQAAGESAPDAHLTAEQNESGRLEKARRGDDGLATGPGFPLIPVLVLLVFVAGAAGGWHLYRERLRDRGQQTSQASSGPVVAAPASPGTSQPSASAPAPQLESAAVKHEGETATAMPISAKPTMMPQTATETKLAGPAASVTTANDSAGPFEITVRAKDRAWVSVKSDGKILLRGVIHPSEVKTIRASNQIVFWTGNAGVVEVSFNGKKVPLSGGENDEQVLVFNSRGLQPRSAAQ